jgi:predicted metalloprotease with PDZ domain
MGDIRLEARDGLRVATLVAPNWPAYAAGLEQDDRLQELDGQRVNADSDVADVLRRHTPGDLVKIAFVDRTGRLKTAAITLVEDPSLEIVPAGAAGGALTAAQRAFRDGWLGPRH